MKEEYKKEIDYLNKSPIYAMSLGSKELFHSNFWAWMIEKYPCFAKVFFENLDDNILVKREEKHRDITIWKGDEAYVIENKLKSIPTKDQLERYTKDLGNKFKSGILTGLVSPNFDLKGINWDFISYSGIEEKIPEILSNNEIEMDDFYKSILEEYCGIIKRISKIIVGLLSKGDDDSFFIADKHTLDKLKTIRLDDVYKKLISSKFIEYFKNKNNSISEKLTISQDYSRGDAIMDFKIENGDDSIGVQIQGNKFKILAERKKLNCHNELFNKYKDCEWFGEYDTLNKKIFHKATNRKNEYNKYSGKTSFVYQYFILDDKIKFSELEEEIKKYLRKACGISENDRKSI